MNRILFLLTIFLILMPQQAMAGIFGPSTEEECIQSYVLKTQSDFAAKVVKGDCARLFKNYTLTGYVSSFYNLEHLGFKMNPKTGKLGAYNQVFNSWENNKAIRYVLLSEANDRGVLSAEQQVERRNIKAELVKEAKDYERKNKQEAKCLLNLKELYQAKNDTAAKMVFANSKCERS